jgi:hypothetical protein
MGEMDGKPGTVAEQAVGWAFLPTVAQNQSPLVGKNAHPACSIPDDHIDPRRLALFVARSILTELRDGAGHADFTYTGKLRRHRLFGRSFWTLTATASGSPNFRARRCSWMPPETGC